MKRKRKKTEGTQNVFLAKEIAELVINRHSNLSFQEIKTAFMTAEKFVLDAMHQNRKE